MGQHGIGRIGEGHHAFGRVADASDASVLFSVDRRGVWLSIADQTQGVHVNGRPVQRIAMLRIGDSVYVDGVEIMLVTSQPVPEIPSALSDAPAESVADPRVVLRGVGGRYHGRSFTLEQPRLVGRSADADVRIDDPAFAERHARIELLGDIIVLRDLGSAEGSVVNGVIVRDATLMPGDQVMFDAHHRFIIEAPARTLATAPVPIEADDGDASQPAPAAGWSIRRLPWLLLAALLIAAALSALLLFGVSS
ncbi:FHA domain-containing protein [Cognatiluteimonas profundi]|uniref:FHA domain-containing protein n=1 Tax=Cognatiluteimonas profundi TaxID=2594501 RepID=UPI003CCDD636